MHTTYQYCPQCNIKFLVDTNLDDEINLCPMCELKERHRLMFQKYKSLSEEVKEYRICGECQKTYGFCDRDRSTCEKLSKVEI